MRLFKHTIAAGIASLCVCGFAYAEDKNSQSKTDKQHHNQKEQGEHRSTDGARYRISPSGWIRMAVDYDNDGSFDAVETIYTYDLEKARKSSRDRANREAQKSANAQRSQRDGQLASSQGSRDERQAGSRGQSSADDRSASNQQREPISGEIIQLQRQTLSGMDEPCVIARVRADNNRSAKVLLGPRSKLQKLKLAEGDRVSIEGRKGRVNDKSILLASTIESDGKQVSVDMPTSRNAKRIRGELLSMRTAEFQNHDGKFVIAEVQCQNGNQSTVNLGAKSKIDQLNLSEGDELRLIVRPAKMNGKPGMVADEVRANGKSVNVSPPNRIARQDRNRDSNNRDQSDRAGSTSKRRSSATDSDSRRPDGDQSADQEAALGISVGETGEGILILGVHPESPAAETDLQVNDEIVSINGGRVDSPSGLVEMIREMKPSDRIQLKIRREGEEQTVRVQLTSRSELMASLR